MIIVKRHVSCHLGNRVLKRHVPLVHLDTILFARVPVGMETLELPSIKGERECVASTSG